jgi:tRNA A-37 threonylcarbamoyl transferase component Bud32
VRLETGDLAAALAPEFEILRVLGRGSVATAYLAREPVLRRLVTIKVPRPSIAEDPRVRHRFEREARAAARVRHPSAATVHRVGQLPDGTPFIVLEYVDGMTLDDVLRAEGPFPVAVGVEILVQVAAALREAHNSGVVHRDVRPNNVFWVLPESRAVLSDFGLAGILETGTEVVTRLTRPGERVGHPAYRSPEQLMGEPATPAADVYALALLGFELLTGERPYTADTPEAMAAAHLRQPPRYLLDLLPGAPVPLAELFARCLSKDPHHRPIMDSVCRALAAVQAEVAQPQPGTGDPVMAVLGRFPSVAAFLVELKKRRVYNVAFAYVLVAFLVLQGAELVMPSLPLPQWSFDALVAVTLAGFPLALALAWMYDVTATGIRRAGAPSLGGPANLGWLLPAAGVLLSLAIAVLIGLWVLSG